MDNQSQMLNLPELEPENFLTPEKFDLLIDTIVLESEGTLNHISAVLEYCDVNDIEYETIAKSCSKSMKEKLHSDAIALNYFKKTTDSVDTLFG